MKILKEDLQKEEEKLKEVMKNWHELMLRVPNIPDVSVPEGDTEADNKELKTLGRNAKILFQAERSYRAYGMA